MHKHIQQISERAGELLSFFSVLPPFLLSSPLLPPVPPLLLFNIPTEGRPYCDGRTRKGATTLLSPPLLPGLNIFGDRDWLMLVIDNILSLSFLIHVQQLYFLSYDKKVNCCFLLWGQLLKASGQMLWTYRKWTLLCLRLHCRMSKAWKQANKRVMKWKNERKKSRRKVFKSLQQLFSAFFFLGQMFLFYCCRSEFPQPKTILSICSSSLSACILCYEEGCLCKVKLNRQNLCDQSMIFKLFLFVCLFCQK